MGGNSERRLYDFSGSNWTSRFYDRKPNFGQNTDTVDNFEQRRLAIYHNKKEMNIEYGVYSNNTEQELE